MQKIFPSGLERIFSHNITSRNKEFSSLFHWLVKIPGFDPKNAEPSVCLQKSPEVGPAQRRFIFWRTNVGRVPYGYFTFPIPVQLEI